MAAASEPAANIEPHVKVKSCRSRLSWADLSSAIFKGNMSRKRRVQRTLGSCLTISRRNIDIGPECRGSKPSATLKARGQRSEPPSRQRHVHVLRSSRFGRCIFELTAARLLRSSAKFADHACSLMEETKSAEIRVWRIIIEWNQASS